MTTVKHKKRTKKQRKNNPIPKTFWKDKQLLIGIGIILFVTFIAFIPSLSNAFVNWDDDVNLLDNPNLRAFDWPSIKNIFVSDVIGGYTPLTILSFAIERAFVGFKPLLYHIDNLLLHMVVVFFVYRVLLMMNISPRAAMIATLLFAIHPMRVESVAWVTERKDVL
ncbi:MAG TPA: hypothetical protein ENK52_00535, partial [Saprospiraceae bacterium]|nr:hypothetical protein [Saprospiraceae bacterium]